MLIGKEKFIGKVPNKKEGTTYIHRWYTNDAKVEGEKKKKHSPGLKTLRGSQPIYEIKQG